MALRKFNIAPNLLTCRSIIQSCPASTRSVSDVFRTASHFFYDLHPWAPVRMMSRVLNSMESGLVRPGVVQATWKVRQNPEDLSLHRYISKLNKEDVKAYYADHDTLNRSKNLLGSAAVGLGPQPAAVLVIECKLAKKLKYPQGEYFDSYTVWIDLQGDLYNINAIKIEKETNQVLKITVPKLKPDYIRKVGIKWYWPGYWRN